MPYYNTEVKTGSAFNPALKYVESIAKLLDILDMCFLKNNYLDSHKVLTRIYQRVEHKLTNEESKSIQTALDNSLKKLIEKEDSKRKRQSNFCIELIKIEKELKRGMDKYGLLMPSKEDPRFAVLKR